MIVTSHIPTHFMNKWLTWLNEPLEFGPDTIPRRSIIHMFVKDGLLPFLRKKGYTVYGGYREIQSAIATGFYKNQGKAFLESDWSMIPVLNDTYNIEDLWHYHHILSQDDWDILWSEWDEWTDISDESRGWDRQQDIQNFIWTQIDLDNSAQTMIVMEHTWGGDDTEDVDAYRRSRNLKDDIYLREAAESNEWGGYRR